jgi:cytochrome c-type biogenesis protein CcmH/NrfF
MRAALKNAGQWVLAAAVSLGATASPAVRYNDLGHQLMCPCSCAQILIECNHVGCPDSDGMLHMLKSAVAGGGSDTMILRMFEAKYGPTVLAAPMLTRFNAVAWIVPPAILILGLLLSLSLIRRWRQTRTLAPAPVALPVRSGPTLDRIRHETEL